VNLAVHEYRIPPQSPAGVVVEHEACDTDRPHAPHFWTAFEGFRSLRRRFFCNGRSER
jgi:hypothetical protein